MSTKDVELDYPYLTQQALRQVVRDVLRVTAELGDVPGEHHFYIEFLTRAQGVDVSDSLLGAYPERMTIVLQHKFEHLQVFDDHFEVTLHFKGEPDRLVVPFSAITNFVDPSCDFGLRFEPGATEGTESEDKTAEVPGESAVPESEAETAATDEAEGSDDASADVVSLDAFRKK